MAEPRLAESGESGRQIATTRNTRRKHPRVLEREIRALPELWARGVGGVADEHQTRSVESRQRDVEVSRRQELLGIVDLIQQVLGAGLELEHALLPARQREVTTREIADRDAPKQADQRDLVGATRAKPARQKAE